MSARHGDEKAARDFQLSVGRCGGGTGGADRSPKNVSPSTTTGGPASTSKSTKGSGRSHPEDSRTVQSKGKPRQRRKASMSVPIGRSADGIAASEASPTSEGSALGESLSDAQCGQLGESCITRRSRDSRNSGGGRIRCCRAQASFSASLWQRQSSQQDSASGQPQGLSWQGKGTPRSFRTRGDAGKPIVPTPSAASSAKTTPPLHGDVVEFRRWDGKPNMACQTANKRLGSARSSQPKLYSTPDLSAIGFPLRRFVAGVGPRRRSSCELISAERALRVVTDAIRLKNRLACWRSVFVLRVMESSSQ